MSSTSDSVRCRGGLVDDHVQLRGGETGPLHAVCLELERPARERQLPDFRLKRLQRQPAVQESAEDHVAAGA